MVPTTNAPRSSRRWNWKVLMLSTTIIGLLYTLIWFGGLRDKVGSFGKPTQTGTSSVVGKGGGSVVREGSDGDIILKGDGIDDGYEQPPQTAAGRAPASPILRTKVTDRISADMSAPPPPPTTSAAKDDDNNINNNKGAASKKARLRGAASYTAMIHALILDELGPDLTAAIYDPDYLEINIVLEALSTHIANSTSTPEDGSTQSKSHQQPWAHPPEPPEATKESIPFISPDHLYFEEQGFNYNHMMIKMAPTIPSSMATIPMTLMTLKRAMSIGLGRMARDARLAENYRELSAASSPSEGSGLVSAFRRSLRTVIKGYGQYATSFLQVVIDGNGRLVELANWDKIHRAVVKKESEDGGGGGSGACTHFETCDPLLLLMSAMRISPPRWAVREVLRTSNAPSTLQLSSRRNNKNSNGGLDDAGTTQLIRTVIRNRAIIGTSIVHGLPIPDRLRPGSSRSHLGGGGGGNYKAAPPSLMENLPMSFRKAMSHFGRFSKEELGQLGEETNTKPTNVHPLPVLVVDDASAATTSPPGDATTTAPAAGEEKSDATQVHKAPKATTQQDLSFALAIEVEQIWNRRLDILDAIVRAATLPPSASIAVELSRVLENTGRSFPANRGLFGLQYQDNLPYTGSAGIVNGRFWNTIRPTVGCASISKQCEEPDGCRYFCNMDYFLAADGFSTSPFSSSTRVATPSSSSDSSSTTKRYGHQVIGFGSNNEYDWEVSLVDAFNRADKAFAAGGGGGEEDTVSSSPAVTTRNGIGRVTVFDCTVRSWTPPKHLTQAAIGFGHGTYCLNNIVHHQPAGRQVVGGGAPSTISFPFLKRSLSVEWESNPLHIKRYTVPEGGGPPASSSIKVEGGEGGGGGGGAEDTKVPPPYYNPKVFDEVSILKLDVEGFEHRTLPNWLTSELSDLGRTRLLSTSNAVDTSSDASLITFDVDAPNTFTVSHYGMELHRLGHKANYAAGYTGALRTHYTLMQLYALGFTMFGQEKNPTDYCCFEIGMVHYRHYVRSETWHVQKA